MNKIVVVYESKYGSTKKYAQWIAEEANADLFDQSKINAKKLKEYDIIVFGGGLYASGIAGVSIITKNYKALKDKTLVVFTVGIASTENEEVFVPIIHKNFKKEMEENITFFHLRGALDYQNLGMIHNLIMRMLKSFVKRKTPEELTKDDQELLASYGKKIDYVDKDTLKPLLSFLETKK